MKLDIAVIGGGASGLTAAVAAARYNSSLKIGVIEANDRVGKKLLSTGNGRCNLGNRDQSIEHYHGCAEQAVRVISTFTGAENYFASMGLFCREDSDGRLYPYSNSAASVLDAFRIELSRLGIVELCGRKVISIVRCNFGCFRIATDNEVIDADAVVLAASGQGIALAESFGHKATPLRPSLMPLRSSSEELTSLAGIRVNAELSLKYQGKCIRTEYGELQFTKDALSGICVFNLSSELRDSADGYSISADLVPENDFSELLDKLELIRSIRAEATAENFLTGLFPKRVGAALLKRSGIGFSEIIDSIQDRKLRILAGNIKQWTFPLHPELLWKNSQAIKGGVSLSETDDSLGSRLVKGLYFSGELLDVDGDCGGYNLTWAWASGSISGTAAASYVGIKRS